MDKRIFEGIQYFISLTQLGSISLVAKEMNTDYKTIKQKINYLEKSINKQLINSSYQGTTLTEEGWSYYHSIISGYNLFNIQVNETTNESLANKNVLDILLTPGSSIFMTSHILPQMYKLHPELLINVTVFDLPYIQLHGSYIRNTINQFNFIAIDEKLIKLIDQDLWVVSYSYVENQKLYASEKYIKETEINEINDMKQTNFIGRTGTPEAKGIIEVKSIKTNKIKSINFKSTVSAHNDLLKSHIANQGLGITLLSDLVLKSEQNLNLINIFPEYESIHKYTYYALHRPNDVNTKYIKSMIKIIKDKLVELELNII